MDKKRVLISIAIAVIFALFVGYGIEVFHDAPERNDYCPDDIYEIDSEEACLEADGKWQTYEKEAYNSELEPVPVIKGNCQNPQKCYDNFSLVNAQHDKIVFIVAIIVGILAVVVGIILRKDAVSTGILSGGILLILYGTLRYWQHADKVLKFVLLGITLALLIWLSYKKLK
jgi:hypothetical protein